MSNLTLFDPFREVSMLHDAMNDFALGASSICARLAHPKARWR
jgi:hypothetical protein